MTLKNKGRSKMKSRIKWFLIVLMLLSFQNEYLCSSENESEFRVPGFHSSIVYMENKFITISQEGRIITSPNGKKWTGRFSVKEALHSVTHGKILIAVGDNGTILTSTDGIKWNLKKLLSPNDKNLLGATYGKQYVVVGDKGLILTSPNGKNWTRRNSGTTKPLRGVAYGEIYVAVGDSGTLLTSPNGKVWTIGKSNTKQNLWGIASGSAFVVVGEKGTILVSQAGMNWKKVNSGTNQHLFTVAYGNKIPLFAAAGSRGKILISTNSERWIEPYTPLSNLKCDFKGITFGDNRIIAVRKGAILRSSKLPPPVRDYTNIKNDCSNTSIRFVPDHSEKIQQPSDSVECNSKRIEGGYPSIVYHPEKAQPFWMWYTGIKDGKKHIHFCKSVDGRIWTQPQPVKNLEGPSDHAQVIYISSKNNYRIYYWDSDKVQKHSLLPLRTAESSDGIFWENDKILKQDEKCSIITGADDLKYSYGPIAVSFNPNPTLKAKITKRNQSNAGRNPFEYKYLMLYDSVSEKENSKGSDDAFQLPSLAVSDDGILFYQWHKLLGKSETPPILLKGEKGEWDSNFITHGSIFRDLRKINKIYYLYGGGEVCAHEGIGMASSDDNGLTWKKCKKNPLIELEPGTWHSLRCSSPFVVSCIKGVFVGVKRLYSVWITGENLKHGKGINYFYLE